MTKSTLPLSINTKIRDWIIDENPIEHFDVVSNPEFLREGAAINDFMQPDRVVVGVEIDRAAQIMAGIYRPLFIARFPDCDHRSR